MELEKEMKSHLKSLENANKQMPTGESHVA
jgi:hypothetical protein